LKWILWYDKIEKNITKDEGIKMKRYTGDKGINNKVLKDLSPLFTEETATLETQESRINLIENEYIDNSFFRTRRVGAKKIQSEDVDPSVLINEITKLLSGLLKDDMTLEDRHKRLLKISEYLTKYGILDNVARTIEKGPIGKIINKIGGENVQDRLKGIASKVDANNEKEVVAIDSFFVNRMAKVVKQIMHHYYKDSIGNMEKATLDLVMDENINIGFEDFFNLTKDQEKNAYDWYKKWCQKNGVSIKSNNYENFKKYIQLRTYKNKLYDAKDSDLCLLCEKFSDSVRDYSREGENQKLLYITLEEYGLPIGLHVPNDKFKYRFSKFDIERASETERDERFATFPIKLEPNEQSKFRGWVKDLKKKLKVKRARGTVRSEEIENEERKSADLNETRKIKEQTIEQVETVESTNEQVNYQEKEHGNNQPEERSEFVGRKRIGRQPKFKSNEEIVGEVCDTLKESKVLENIPEEYVKKLLETSEKQQTKMEKILNYIKDFLGKRGIAGEELETEAAKMFCYLKLTERGFWSNLSNENAREESYGKSYEEIGKFGDEFFESINNGKNPDEIREWIDAVAKRKRTIKGAKTISTKEKVNEELNSEKVIIEPEIAEPETAEPELVEPKISIDDSEIETNEVENSETEFESLEDKLEQLREQYQELAEQEKIEREKKAKLEAELNQIINDKETLKVKKSKVKALLTAENVEFFKSIGFEEKVEEALRRLQEIEKELEENAKKEKKTKGEIDESEENIQKLAEEMNEIKDEVEKTTSEFFHDL